MKAEEEEVGWQEKEEERNKARQGKALKQSGQFLQSPKWCLIYVVKKTLQQSEKGRKHFTGKT